MSDIGRSDDVVYRQRALELREMLTSLSDHDVPVPGMTRRVTDLRAQLLADVGIPLSTFRGTLKQVPSELLNEMARKIMDTVFPTFSDTVKFDPEQVLEKMRRDLGDQHGELFDAVEDHLAGEKSRDERQERRYAGDRNMSRGRYFTVCDDSGGGDSQTLCRELFAYVNSYVPGWIFVGDPWDSELYQKLGGDNAPEEMRNCVYVFMLEPLDDSEHAAYQQAYMPVLEQLANPNGLKILPIPVRWYDVEIPLVLDLRQPEAQDWLFRFFRAGDGAVLVKPTEPARSFIDMLPALYHPYRGGSGVTAGIGSWLRTMGVNALVYPSSRSDASIQVDSEGELISARGWNLIAYLDEAPTDRQIHVDSNPWYSFEGAGYEGVEVHRAGGSWHLSGIEKGYDWTRKLILNALEGGRKLAD